VAEVLHRRLVPASRRPLAVALSGGGDSAALLVAAAAWAAGANRLLLVLTVDHRLQPESAAWTQVCAERAASLGASFRALAWEGPKPARGLSTAARAARHRLLAQAAREAGASVVVMGHTADDVLEARAMRAAGSTTPEPREWAPSPVWPEGRTVFLLRPLLGLRRAEIRDWLVARGETWIEDPANVDPASARARARRDLAEAPMAAPHEPAQPRALAALTEMDAAGGLGVSRDALRLAPRANAQAFVGAACLCAAGGDRAPAAEPLKGLVRRLLSHEPVTATLAGARIEADADEVRFLREAGEAARGGLAPLQLAAGDTGVWDGRFEISAERPFEVRTLRSLAARLGGADRAALRPIPARARPALPVSVEGDDVRLLKARPLALERLHAACGLVEREPA
jgi:tRNA(Ile)-lysidine synthase